MYWSMQPEQLDVATDAGNVELSTSRRMVLRGACASVRWATNANLELTLNSERIPSTGEQMVCPTTSTGYRFRISDQTGASTVQTLYVRVFLMTLNTQIFFLLSIVCITGLAVLLAIFGDLPWLSETRPILTLSKRLSQLRSKTTLYILIIECQIDLFFVLLLSLLAALPLILIRYTHLAGEMALAGGAVFVWILAFVAWQVEFRSRLQLRTQPARHSRVSKTGRPRSGHLHWIVLVLLVTTVIGFYVPMRTQFWLGGDEIHVLNYGTEGWSAIARYDSEYGRPLTPLGSIIAISITPDSIHGYLWIAFLLRFFTAVAVYGVMTLIIPNPALGLSAALLFIVNPSESTRYLAVYMHAYNLAVFLMIASMYIFLRSSKSFNRALLILSCLGLGMSLLIVEVGYATSLIWPVLLWFVEKRSSRRLVWTFTWFITVLLLVIRFLQYNATTAASYQSSLLGDRIDLAGMVENFWHQLGLSVAFLQIPSAPIAHWAIGLALSLIVFVALLRPIFIPSKPQQKRQYVISTSLLVLAIVLSFLPYLPINGILATMRTQFLSAPFQAMAWATLVGFVALQIPRWQSRLWRALLVGTLVMIATVNGLNYQANRSINPLVTFDTTSKIVQQTVQLVPNVKPETALIFFLNAPEATESLLGWNYYVLDLSNFILGVDGFQVNYTDSLGINHPLEETGTTGRYNYAKHSFDQLILLQLDQAGNVTLLRDLPDFINESLPDSYVSGYDPLARIDRTTENSRELRFFTTQVIN